MNPDYLPGAGTVPARVVAYLHSLPVGTEVGTGTIAEAIDADIAAIFSGTNAACMAGLIDREKFGNRYLWRRGPRDVEPAFIASHPPKRHVELPAPTPLSERLSTPREIPADDAPPPTLAMATAMRTERETAAQDRPSVPVSLAPPPPPPPQSQERQRPRAAAEAAHAMRIGLFSDGSLCIERAGRIENYNPDEAQQLTHLLDLMLLRGRAVA